MFTLQRPPLILCADVFDEVNFNEYPAPTNLATGDDAGSGFIEECDGMDFKKDSSFLEGKGVH